MDEHEEHCPCGEYLQEVQARLEVALAALRLYADSQSYYGRVHYDGLGRIHISNAALADCGLAAREALAAQHPSARGAS